MLNSLSENSFLKLWPQSPHTRYLKFAGMETCELYHYSREGNQFEFETISGASNGADLYIVLNKYIIYIYYCTRMCILNNFYWRINILRIMRDAFAVREICVKTESHCFFTRRWKRE